VIGPDLEGADLASRVASRAASAISSDAAAVGAVIEAYGGRVAADVAGVVRQYTHGGHWKITRYMYQQMPEQPGGDCSGI
jgi:hypothetical protein